MTFKATHCVRIMSSSTCLISFQHFQENKVYEKATYLSFFPVCVFSELLSSIFPDLCACFIEHLVVPFNECWLILTKLTWINFSSQKGFRMFFPFPKSGFGYIMGWSGLSMILAKTFADVSTKSKSLNTFGIFSTPY